MQHGTAENTKFSTPQQKAKIYKQTSIFGVSLFLNGKYCTFHVSTRPRRFSEHVIRDGFFCRFRLDKCSPSNYQWQMSHEYTACLMTGSLCQGFWNNPHNDWVVFDKNPALLALGPQILHQQNWKFSWLIHLFWYKKSHSKNTHTHAPKRSSNLLCSCRK